MFKINSRKKLKWQSKCLPIHCPEKPAVPKSPSIKITNSTFIDDWYKTLQDPKFYDVTFIVEGATFLNAHSIVLCASCPLFEKLLDTSSPTGSLKQQGPDEDEHFNGEELSARKIEGISALYESETTSGRHTTIKLSTDIKAKTFVKVLEFLYTGRPRLENDMGDEELQDLKYLSGVFELPDFDTVCGNIVRREEFLNANILALFNHQRVSKLKSLFFNQSRCSDVVFLVDGRRVYAHKIVLCTRSNVMAAMFSGHFLEGKSGILTEITVPETSYENFCAFLEYLYTDHAPLKQTNDVIGLLALADEKNQYRLVNLCELYISRMVGKAFQHSAEESDLNVIGLLNTAQMFNAQQLMKWCLHFISINYETFSKRKEFPTLNGEDKLYVELNRWPPLSYLESLETYEREMAAEQRRSRKDACAVT